MSGSSNSSSFKLASLLPKFDIGSVLFGASLSLAGVALYRYSSRRSNAPSALSDNPYETDTLVQQYILMHYGTARELLPLPAAYGDRAAEAISFPAECAALCIKHIKGTSFKGPLRALDVGCAVGRSTFELARMFDEVIGIDFSHAFINTANYLKQHGEIEASYQREGDIYEKSLFTVDPTIPRARAHFQHGDACSLSAATLGQFHVLLAANLLCRLPSPHAFLASASSLIVNGGFLVMPSPYTWLTQYTNKDKWVGGYEQDGKRVFTFDKLKEILVGSGYFVLVEEKNMPFFIRETQRKNQWSVSHGTVWQRTDKL